MTSAAKPIPTPGAIHACADEACRRPCQGFGMSAQTQVVAYAREMASLQGEWAGLTPRQRMARLQSVVGNQAKAAGFPQPQVVADEGLGTARNGELRFQDWQVAINQSLVNLPALDAAKAVALGDTLFHEVRHAEQWFLIARRQAAEGMTSADIRKQLSLPSRITDAAARVPLEAESAGRACADAMYSSVYGAGSAHRGTTLGNLASGGEAVREDAAANDTALADLARARRAAAADKLALDALKARVPAATAIELQSALLQSQFSAQRLALAQEASAAAYAKAKASFDAYQATYAAYRALPEEADAWDAGTRAAAAVTSALAPPPSP